MLPIVKLFDNGIQLRRAFNKDVERLKEKNIFHKAHYGQEKFISSYEHNTVVYLTFHEYKIWCIGRTYILYGEPHRSGLPADDIVLVKRTD